MKDNEKQAIEMMIAYSKTVVNTKATQNELDIAKKIAFSVIQGDFHKIFVENATRKQRQRLIGIAFNMVKSKKKSWCNKCSNGCMKTCCYNEILQRRFAEEMFPGFVIY